MITVFPGTVRVLRNRLTDHRGGTVLFVSHCLLNENTRYMGGAFCAGFPREMHELLYALDCGVVQMICPERVAWGGIHKPYLYQFHGIGRWRIVHSLCAFFMPLYLFLVNWRMRWIARYTASEIADYIQSGMKVLGIVGVRGSPACGVTCYPDLRRYFEWSSKVDIHGVTPTAQNQVLKSIAREGSGVFVKHLRRQLEKRGLAVPFFEFDLYDEMDGISNGALHEATSQLLAIAHSCKGAPSS